MRALFQPVSARDAEQADEFVRRGGDMAVASGKLAAGIGSGQRAQALA
jgi:hypothetical protein